jgi:pimeloyl-ACP methyl ester carboxylesterase
MTGRPGGSRLLTEDTETLGVSGTPQLYAERVVGPRGAPVLFVHGFGVSGRLWRSSGWIREIDRLGRGWIAPDLRGHGRSDRLHDPEAYETRELVGDLIRVLDAAGVERADVIGYSLGGELAVEFAIAHPTRTHHVIAGGIGYRRPLDLDDMAALHGELTTGRTPTLTSAGRRMWATGCRTPGSDPIALAAFLAGVAASGQIAGYERLEGRVLLFAGSDDPIAAGIEAIRDRIRRAELLRLAGRDHVSAVSAPAARSRAAMLLSRT